MTPAQFIDRWEMSGAAERANYQLFLTELCALLEVPQPDPTRPDDADNAYVFERNVHFLEDNGDTTIGRIDLYRRGSFVLEAKQGSDAQTADEQAAKLLSASSKISKRRGTAVRGTKGWDDAMVRAGAELTANERTVHEQGLVSVLKQIHDDLDAAVFDAYGWPATLSDEEILERLVALNAERAAEEARGIVRWLRPEFQNPAGDGKQQQPLDLVETNESEEQSTGKSSGTRGELLTSPPTPRIP